MKKLLSTLIATSLVFSPMMIKNNETYAIAERNDKAYIIVTGFTHFWGFAENDAIDTVIQEMPFSTENYKIITKTDLYDIDNKKVKVGFGDSFQDGGIINLRRWDDAFGITNAVLHPYDPSFKGVEEERWSSVGISLATGHNVGFNSTERAQNKRMYNDQYFDRASNISNLTSVFNENEMTLSYKHINTLPEFNFTDLEDLGNRVVRLDHLARRSFGEVDLLMTEFSGADWKDYYPEVVQRLQEAQQPGNEKLRGYMVFTPYILELTLKQRPELALADTIFQEDKTSFTDETGTLRDKMEIFDEKGNMIFGDTIERGREYTACSYMQNQGDLTIDGEVFIDSHVVRNDVYNFNIADHLKEYTGLIFPNHKAGHDGWVRPWDTIKFCSVFTANTREIRVEHKIPSVYIPGWDTREENNKAMRILKVEAEDLAVRDINITENFKITGTNVYEIDVAKVLGNKTVDSVITNIEVKDANGDILYNRDLSSSRSLRKDENYTYTVAVSNTSRTNRNTVCATISPLHALRGEDDIISNNTMCKDFTNVLDISLSNFHISPHKLYLDKEGEAVERDLSFNVNINTAGQKGTFNTNIAFKDSTGSIIHTDRVTITTDNPKVYSFQKRLNVKEGANVFIAEVNLNPKKISEINNTSNAYSNNVASTSITALFANAERICTVNQNRDEFDITYIRRTQRGNWERRWDSEGKSYWVCVREPEKIEEITITHYEQHRIRGIMFRSKDTKDAFLRTTNRRENIAAADEGWTNLLNASERDRATVAAGMGVELIIETEYRHNFDDAPEPKNAGDCGTSTVSPSSPSSSRPPERIRLSLDKESRYFTTPTSIQNFEDGEIRKYELRGSDEAGRGIGDKLFIKEDARKGDTTRIAIEIEDFTTDRNITLCDRRNAEFEIGGHFSHYFITQIVQ